MKASEACQHDWKKGEKVWAVIHQPVRIPGYGYTDRKQPVRVQEITVKSFEKGMFTEEIQTMYVSFKVDGRCCKFPDKDLEAAWNVNEPDDTGEGKMNCAGKFFTYEEAVERFKKEIDEFNEELSQIQAYLDKKADKVGKLTESICDGMHVISDLSTKCEHLKKIVPVF